MQVVFNGHRVKLVDATTELPIDVKELLCEVVAAARVTDDDAAPLDLLLEHLRTGVERYPTVQAVHHPGMECQGIVIRYELDGEVRYNAVLCVWMPCNESRLLWMPWLPHQTKPVRAPGEFHHVKFGAFYALQARKTKCYGYSYTYSGQTHPLEAETPAEIQALYRETNAIFGLPLDGVGGANMCLVNDYSNGRHYIDEHSDDERAFGVIHHVFCWVDGAASREGLFRVRTMGGKKRNQISPELQQYCCDPSNAYKTRDLLGLCFPAGFYVMCGRDFQQRYSHEFPVSHKAMFDRMIKKCSAEDGPFDDFPREVEATEKGASQRPVVQAGWLQDHREQVLEKIRAGAFSKGKKRARDFEDFEDWCLSRTSYTLRNFRAGKK